MRCPECDTSIDQVYVHGGNVDDALEEFHFVVEVEAGHPRVKKVTRYNLWSDKNDEQAEEFALFDEKKCLAAVQRYLDAGDFGDGDILCPECGNEIEAPWFQHVSNYLNEIAKELGTFPVTVPPLDQGRIVFIYDGETGSWKWKEGKQ